MANKNMNLFLITLEWMAHETHQQSLAYKLGSWQLEQTNASEMSLMAATSPMVLMTNFLMAFDLEQARVGATNGVDEAAVVLGMTSVALLGMTSVALLGVHLEPNFNFESSNPPAMEKTRQQLNFQVYFQIKYLFLSKKLFLKMHKN